ncbi:hypothetical protein [Legionella fallonii]|uniref:Uncharacterized protein n=1 Tax=Legionella fallonii LLAP-10 TaxID=1212491 RepID=A0A098G5M3_9GAMM|nr:hypothetical protein [Legionella fallonii]CEG57276.1 protein of unknown function [Leucine rich repeat containing protein] [Legionella fallonii LLAP-10]
MRQKILSKITESINSSQVNLANINITDDEIKEVMDKIQEINPDASRFDLDNNALSDKGALILSECLHNFREVKELSLQFNNIGKEGAIGLFSLKNNFSTLDIPFHGNRIKSVAEMFEIEKLAQQENSFKP